MVNMTVKDDFYRAANRNTLCSVYYTLCECLMTFFFVFLFKAFREWQARFQAISLVDEYIEVSLIVN